MSLSNYARSRSRRNGGIRLIGLVEQSDVAEVTYASAEKGYSAIRLDEDCYFSKYEFREDEAEYRELIFTLDKMGNDSSPAITSIADAARNGLIALLTTPNGDSFLVGYSVEFEKERPLRLVSANGTTGKQLAEGTNEVITLRSQDVSKAKPFFGDMETLFSAAG